MNLIATFAIALLSSVLYFTIFWSLSLRLKKPGLVNIAWSSGFFIIYLITLVINKNFGFVQNLILLLLFLWGIRLSFYLLIRKKFISELNYNVLKEKWGKRFLIHSYLKVFLVHAFLLVVIASPAIFISTYIATTRIELTFVIIAFIWLLGFLIEAIADIQMYEFKKTHSEESILTKGLWRFSRHPNYLGECIMWSCIFLIASAVPGGIITIISPIIIIIMLVRYTGIRPNEEKFKDNPEYIKYIENTGVLIPIVKDEWFKNFRK